MPRWFAALGMLSGALTASADWLQTLDDVLFIETEKGWFRTDISGLLDFELFYIDQNPPGLLFSNDDWLVSPRLSLFLDTRFGKRFYSLVQVRIDRGFDPGYMPDGHARVDEYLLRYTPFDENWTSLQVGKFATVFGHWVQRHDTWQNPFVNAPLLYENVTVITDQTAPATARGFLNRKNRPDEKHTWLPVLWGPAYTSGASVSGTIQGFDYAFECKNASVSSRPAVWDATELGWAHPTVGGRVGYRPNATWNFGASFSHGTYLLPAATDSLPTGSGLEDFDQKTVGADVSFAWRHWQVWAEAIASTFEVPRVGDAAAAGYFLETRYKFTPRFYGALRWNQQWFDDVQAPLGSGGSEDWDQDAWRAEAALGYRWTRHFQTKIQYGYSHQNGEFQQGEQLFAFQATIKF